MGEQVAAALADLELPTVSTSSTSARDTWRDIFINGTLWKDTSTSSGRMNLIPGANVHFSQDGNDLTISADGGSASYSAGDGLSLNGTTFSVNLATNSGLGFDSSSPKKLRVTNPLPSVGSNGQVLKVVNGAPAWSTADTDTVRAIHVSGTNFLSTDPNTGFVNITVGTLSVSQDVLSWSTASVTGGKDLKLNFEANANYFGSDSEGLKLIAGYGDYANPYGSKIANYILAAPNGSAGAPSFRALVAADIPNGIAASKIAGLSALATFALPEDPGANRYLIYDNSEESLAWVVSPNTDTWRPIKYSSTTLSDNTTTLEFIAGTNVGLSFTNGQLTISATDTNTTYTLSLPTTGEHAGQLGLVAGGSGSGTTWYTTPWYTKPSTGIPASDIAGGSAGTVLYSASGGPAWT